VPQVIGRDDELAAADEFLERARQRFAGFLIEGEPGIGKTTVWREIVAQAERQGFLVLSCRPAEAEAKLSFSALSDLFESVPSEVYESLETPRRRALDIALLRRDPGRARLDRRAVAAAVRSLLTILAFERPVVIGVDDVQWLDGGSAGVLEFAIRRLGREPIGLVASRRRREPARLELEGVLPSGSLTRLRLGPLTVAGLHHLLKERLGDAPSRSTLIRIHQASGGNPLFALEVARLLADAGTPPAAEPLPVPSDVRELIRRRVARLPRPTREVLLAAATLSDPGDEVVRAALGRAVVADLEPAERQQIAVLERGAIAFTHPLFAGAIYSSATAAERRAMHRRLAETVASSEARARHLALAAEGCHETAAAAAHAAADEAAARGAPAAAAELAELALGLTEPGSEAYGLRLVDLAAYLHAAGETERACSLLETISFSRSWPPALQASAVELLGGLMSYTKGPAAMVEVGERALREPLPAQPRAAGHLAVSYGAGFADAERSLHQAEAALELLQPLGDEVDPALLASALTLRARAGAVLGHGLDRDVVDRVLTLEARLPRGGDSWAGAFGGWLRWVDDVEGSRRMLERVAEEAAETGHEPRLVVASIQLALTECLAGNLRLARAYAARAVTISEELEAGELAAMAAEALALAEANLGHPEKVHELLGAAGHRRRSRGVLGLLELSLANYAAADAHLRAALELFEQARFREPGIDRFHADAAEAAVALGDLGRAEVIADYLEVHGRRTGRRWSLATGARVRALIAAARGDLQAGLAACERALGHHDRLPMPVEQARTLLVKGVIERRARKRGKARESLEDALGILERCGARLWAERARTELERLGLRRGSRDELTENERRVAELAASGLTNREVAAALYMTPKTVEANLSRVYRKLAIASRAELGARMGERTQT
jgi:DNA-binding CsgD family transcriptional regulator